MNTRVIICIILISFGSIAAILPKENTSSIRLNADQMLHEIRLATNLISPDELADLLINKDPSILLIDVRDSIEYGKFHLPGAINIPLNNLLNDNWIPYIDQISQNNIFYSNGTMLSSEAWIITKQLGFKNNFVLSGGINEWFATIIKPERPTSMAPTEEWALYNKRKASGMFFTGSKASSADEAALSLPPVPRKKKSRVQGGCS